MPHADALALPVEILTRVEFYDHVTSSLTHLLATTPAGSGKAQKLHWLPALANAASLLWGSFENFEAVWGRQDGRRVNWSGFYLHPRLIDTHHADEARELVLGPFHGRPACLSVSLTSPSPKRPLGVCATAFTTRETTVVADVDSHPGHIACDGATRSEIVVPVILDDGTAVGVLDIDCEQLGAFGDDDRAGLEKFVLALVRLVDWQGLSR